MVSRTTKIDPLYVELVIQPAVLVVEIWYKEILNVEKFINGSEWQQRYFWGGIGRVLYARLVAQCTSIKKMGDETGQLGPRPGVDQSMYVPIREKWRMPGRERTSIRKASPSRG